MSATNDYPAAKVETQRGWAYKQAQFPPPLPHDPSARPILIIDVGDGNGGFDHPLLNGRVTRAERRDDDVLHGAHSAEIAGVIAQACPAQIYFYDIGQSGPWDQDLFVDALNYARTMDPTPAVINISVAWKESWDKADKAINACIKDGISVVAAMGDTAGYKDVLDMGDNPDCKDAAVGAVKGNKWYADDWYPAKLADDTAVIAVAGTDVNDLRLPDSDTGGHVSLAAPGEDIVTVVSRQNLGTRNGTSFAAALVAAAVWWIKHDKPELCPAEIKEILCCAADGRRVECDSPKSKGSKHGRPWDSNIGNGVLKVPRFAKQRPDDPPDPSAVSTPSNFESLVIGAGTTQTQSS
jgi:hypothetical protein